MTGKFSFFILAAIIGIVASQDELLEVLEDLPHEYVEFIEVKPYQPERNDELLKQGNVLTLCNEDYEIFLDKKPIDCNRLTFAFKQVALREKRDADEGSGFGTNEEIAKEENSEEKIDPINAAEESIEPISAEESNETSAQENVKDENIFYHSKEESEEESAPEKEQKLPALPDLSEAEPKENETSSDSDKIPETPTNPEVTAPKKARKLPPILPTDLAEVEPKEETSSEVAASEPKTNLKEAEEINDRQDGNTLLELQSTEAILKNMPQSETDVKTEESKEVAAAGAKDTTILITLFAAVVVIGVVAFAYNFIKKRRQANAQPNLQATLRASLQSLTKPKLDESEAGVEMKPLMKEPLEKTQNGAQYSEVSERK